MKEFGGWFFPAHERHMIEWLAQYNDVDEGRLRYQGKKQRAVLKLCPPERRRVAVDVGAHVGLWSYYLAKEFAHVHAFEPIAEHRVCFERNVIAENVLLYHSALGECEQCVSMHITPTSSGGTWVSSVGAGDARMARLDTFELDDVDLIKIDCEGRELPVLQGAEQTLRRCKPVVIVEQKPGMAQKFGLAEQGAVEYLRSLGAEVRAAMSGDFLLSWS